MNLLIVDDSAAMRMMIVRTLRQAGLGGHDVGEAILAMVLWAMDNQADGRAVRRLECVQGLLNCDQLVA